MSMKSFRSVFPLFEEGVRGSLLLLFLFFALSLNAQMLKVYKNGTLVYCLEEADSVVFCPSLNKALLGVFSVSEAKQIRFSCGNLQYTQSTQTWSFAENQYDMFGTNNVYGGTEQLNTYGYHKQGTALSDTIDLFGWSGSTGGAKWGISISENSYTDYSGDFVDWGANIGDGQTWYTLTYDEWSYLISGRTNAYNLRSVARIKLNADGSEYAKGLILLPDNWTCPADVTFKSGSATAYNEQAYADYQTLSLSDWQKLEAAGAVFLPASGYRNGASMNFVQNIGSYWSATPYYSGSAYVLHFYSDEAKNKDDTRYIGNAVRLVRDL